MTVVEWFNQITVTEVDNWAKDVIVWSFSIVAVVVILVIIVKIIENYRYYHSK